jgi:hypothetical protein
MRYVAIVNDWAGDQHVYGPFRSEAAASVFCTTHAWGPSFNPDESGQVPFGIVPLTSPKDAN